MKSKTITTQQVTEVEEVVLVYEAGDMLEVIAGDRTIVGDKILIFREEYPIYQLAFFCFKKKEFLDVGYRSSLSGMKLKYVKNILKD